jgi:hypothetical protein
MLDDDFCEIALSLAGCRGQSTGSKCFIDCRAGKSSTDCCSKVKKEIGLVQRYGVCMVFFFFLTGARNHNDHP